MSFRFPRIPEVVLSVERGVLVSCSTLSLEQVLLCPALVGDSHCLLLGAVWEGMGVAGAPAYLQLRTCY